MYFEQVIKEKPSIFVGMIKRNIARASDHGIYFTIPDEMLLPDKNPIKICWENELEIAGKLIPASGLGWIDGHQLPGSKTKLTIIYPNDKPHLARWDRIGVAAKDINTGRSLWPVRAPTGLGDTESTGGCLRRGRDRVAISAKATRPLARPSLGPRTQTLNPNP